MSGKSGALSIVLAIGLFSGSAPAQAPPDRPPSGQQAAAETLKERLSGKASVNNCKVPKDRRGPKPRPGCPQDEAARAKPRQ